MFVLFSFDKNNWNDKVFSEIDKKYKNMVQLLFSCTQIFYLCNKNL